MRRRQCGAGREPRARVSRRARSVRGAAAFAIVAAAALLPACGPAYHGADFADNTDAGMRPRQRAKPRVPSALLKPLAPPDCGESPATDARPPAAPETAQPAAASTTQPEGGGAAGSPSNAQLALRVRLEYERECYRQAEARARARLDELQRKVKETVKSHDAAE